MAVSTDRRFGVSSGLAVKAPVRAATTANITLSGEQTIDGVACVTNDRVLVKDQTTGSENGIYVVDTSAWKRAADFDGAYDVTQGTTVRVTQGTTYANAVFRVSTAAPITIGTTSIAFLRILEVLDVKDYGAVGDGATDDREAIQDAIDTGRAVYAQAGTYSIPDPGLYHEDGLRLYGDGKTKTIFKKPASDGTTNLDPILRERVTAGTPTSATGITVERIGFEGNGDPAVLSTKGAGLMRFYEVYGLRAISCAFYRGRGYGAGFQGTAASADADKRGPQEDIYFEDCDFYENGKQAYLSVSDPDDGIDFKSSDRATMINCRAWDNGDKGFDVRARELTMIACHSWSNAGAGFGVAPEGVQAGVTSITPATATYVACWSYDNTGNGFAVIPQVTPGVVDGLFAVTFSACHAYNNSHNFALTSKGTNDLAVTRIVMQGCTSRDPVTGTRHFLASDAAESVTVSGGSYVGGTTQGISIHSSQTGPTNISGATFENIGGIAITGSTNASAHCNVSGNTFKDIGSAVFSGNSNNTFAGNTYENIGSTTVFAFTGTNNKVLDKPVGERTVASAGTVTLPEITDTFVISGTTGITSITASWAGRIVALRFADILTLTDGSNLKLAGNFTTSSDDMLLLSCDGTNWRELSRSVN